MTVTEKSPSTSQISPEVRKQAPIILAEIQKATSILLHCHPSPDPDSVGSALAMKFALEQLGKKATVIKGDSEFPQAFMHFPGAQEIVQKNYLEIDPDQFDLFLILDSARIEMVSRRGTVTFPPNLKTIIIDHHLSNSRYASINLVDTSYPANCLLLADLFSLWGIKMTPEIAANLFIGAYNDTGGLKYSGVTARTYEIMAGFVAFIPDISKLIGGVENSNTKEFLLFEAAALSSVETFLDGKMAMTYVPLSFLKEKNIPPGDVRTSDISSFLRTVLDWNIVAAAVEIEPGLIKFSFRSKDADKYDVAALTGSLGGGGHRAAAGLIVKGSWDEVKQLVVARAKELYNL